MLRTEEVLFILDSIDFFKDSLLEAQRREREARGLDF
jgi:hypothetical protein